MKHLVYCIYQKESCTPAEGPFQGIDGHPVHQILAGDLAAAVSNVSVPVSSADITTIAGYHAVIDHFHRCRTVIPLRFGTLLDSELEVKSLLQNQRSRYEKLLRELHGRVEMGIRVIIPDQKSWPETRLSSVQFSSPGPRTRGLSYLASRKAHYLADSMLAEENAQVRRAYSAPFAGMYSKIKCEITIFRPNNDEQLQSTLLSLYFLIPRDSLEDFRWTFAGLKSCEPAKMLLSGPWPPYNFVLPSDSSGQGSGYDWPGT